MWASFLKHKSAVSLISLGLAAFLTILTWNIKIQVKEEQKPFKEEMSMSLNLINNNIKSLKELSILQEEKMQQFSTSLATETAYLNNTLRVEVQRNAESKASKLELNSVKQELNQKLDSVTFWQAIHDIENRLDTFEIASAVVESRLDTLETGSAVHEGYHDTTHVQDYHTSKAHHD